MIKAINEKINSLSRMHLILLVLACYAGMRAHQEINEMLLNDKIEAVATHLNITFE